MKKIISVSILSADFTRLGDQIRQCEDAGVDWIHIDVMDGQFVPNITMGPFIVEAARRASNLPLDVHLMIEKPERHIQSFANAGANNITVQAETCPDLAHSLQMVRAAGCLSGVAYNPATEVDIPPSLFPILDMVLVMTVNPGYSGQSYMTGMDTKVLKTRNLLGTSDHFINLEVDGGINSTTLPLVLAAGANVFVAASAIFHHPEGIMKGVRDLRKVIDA